MRGCPTVAAFKRFDCFLNQRYYIASGQRFAVIRITRCGHGLVTRPLSSQQQLTFGGPCVFADFLVLSLPRTFSGRNLRHPVGRLFPLCTCPAVSSSLARCSVSRSRFLLPSWLKYRRTIKDYTDSGIQRT